MRINRTTGSFVGILTALSAWMLCGALTLAQASCRIQNISLERAGKFTKVIVQADQPWEMIHSTEEAKDGKPYRVIIDCKDALFALPQNNFEKNLPSETILGIRTSQYQIDPERIVRVVLDLKSPVVYKVLETPDKREACIAVMTAQDPDFPRWTAVQAGENGPRPTATSEKSVALAQTTTKSESAQKAWIFPRAVSYADTGESQSVARENAAFSTRTTISQSGKDQTTKGVGSDLKKPSGQDATKYTATADAKQVMTKPTAQRRKIDRHPAPLGPFPEEATMAQKSHEDQGKSAEGSEQVVATPITSGKTDKVGRPSVSSSGSKQTLVQRPPRRRRINRSPTPLGPYTQEFTLADASGQTETVAPQDKPTETATEAKGTIAQGLGKILGPESVVAKETQVLPESLSLAGQAPQIELELVPQRKVVSYDAGGKRDPFVPLTDKKDMSFGAVPPPLFENLKLVGILRDVQGNRALLEDEMGFGYILVGGDRIKNGYVISVEDDKATFRIEEYGGYHIMVLELNQEY